MTPRRSCWACKKQRRCFAIAPSTTPCRALAIVSRCALQAFRVHSHSLLQRFNDYKANTKRSLMSALFNLEALFNKLSTRLSESQHPPFVPSSKELLVDALAERIRNLQSLEQVEAVLNAEMTRQFQLVQCEQQHLSSADKITQWTSAQIAALAATTEATTSGEARTRIKFLEAIVKARSMLSDSRDLNAHRNTGKPPPSNSPRPKSSVAILSTSVLSAQKPHWRASETSLPRWPASVRFACPP